MAEGFQRFPDRRRRCDLGEKRVASAYPLRFRQSHPLPQALQSVSVTIGGLTAPLFYVSAGQINFQVPPELPLGAAALVVRRGGQASAPRAVTVTASTAGIFVNGSAASPVVVHASDFSLVTSLNPAHAGEYLAVFCTGLGATNPGIAAGAAAPPQPVPLQASLETVVDSRLLPNTAYAGLAPGFAGLYQVNFQLEGDEAPGTKVLYVQPGGGSASNEVSFPVRVIQGAPVTRKPAASHRRAGRRPRPPAAPLPGGPRTRPRRRASARRKKSSPDAATAGARGRIRPPRS